MNHLSHYIESIDKLVPEFKDIWESKNSSFNFGSDSTIHGLFSEFSHLVSSALEKEELKNAQKIFDYIEAVITNGGEASNAAYTCFLENIFNRTPELINPNSFEHFLGINSKAFYKKYKNY